MTMFDETKHFRGQPGNPGQFALKENTAVDESVLIGLLPSGQAVIDEHLAEEAERLDLAPAGFMDLTPEDAAELFADQP